MPSSQFINPLPSVEYLRACFTYDPETGELRWKKRPREHFALTRMWKTWNTKHAGTVAGTAINKGHHCIGLDHHLYFVHRIVWKLMTGEEPPPSIDHKDGNGLNNRWNNLRATTAVQQQQNRKRQKNISGYRGVYQSGGRWRARIRSNYLRRNLGSFATPAEAAAVYEAAARKLFGEFYREN